MLQFSIRRLLAITVAWALALLPLTFPSTRWLLPFPAAMCLLSVFVISRFDLSPARGRIFWLSLLVGALVYLSCVAIIGSIYFWAEYPDIWFMFVGEVLSTYLHDDVDWDIYSFCITLHILAAFVIAGAAGCAAQHAAERREGRVSK